MDRDPSVSVPINDIEEGIRDAIVCFADITCDNPNVWFELGYAIASEKEICLICSRERQGKFPFDVQHRSIIRYGVESPSDFHQLQKQITERLRAMQESMQKLAAFSTKSPIREDHGLSQHEQIVLATILEICDGPGDSVPHFSVKKRLDILGYNNIALNIGIMGLVRKNMLTISQSEDLNGNMFNVYFIAEPGMDWLMKNYEKLDLGSYRTARTPPTRTGGPSWEAPKGGDLDDEIPF